MEELPDQYKEEWSCNIVEAVSERYLGDSLLVYLNILSMLTIILGPSQTRIDIPVISFSLMKLFVHTDILRSRLRS